MEDKMERRKQIKKQAGNMTELTTQGHVGGNTGRFLVSAFHSGRVGGKPVEAGLEKGFCHGKFCP